MKKNHNLERLNVQLFNAASTGANADIVEALINGAQINSRHELGYTPIFIATAYNHSESVKLLYYMGADIDAVTDEGATPLFNSAYNCHSQITQFLLSLGVNKETALFKGYTPFHVAISSGCVEDVRLLLEAGALIHSDDALVTPILLATQERNRTPEHKQIYNIIMDHYHANLADSQHNVVGDTSLRSFGVVVARYDEDLLWLNKEFKDEKIIVYNKGKDDLDLNNLPVHTIVRNIPNVGWFGGTILYHLANYYDYLDDRTAFFQGESRDQPVFLPEIKYKTNIPSKCNNIVAKCVETTLLKESNVFLYTTEEEWAKTKYGGKFKLFSNYTMIDFARQYVDSEIVPEDPLPMVWGAQFSVDKENVYLHKQEFYQRMLPIFNETYPMADFYLEKLWHRIFQRGDIVKLNEQLFEAFWVEDKQAIIDLLSQGADINSQHAKGATALYLVATNNKLEMVELLVKEGADLDIPIEDGSTPLYAASAKCYSKVVKTLIDAGADLEKGVDGYTPLAAAIYYGCKDNVVQLLDAGAEIYSDVSYNYSDILSYHKVRIPLNLNSFLYNKEEKTSATDEIYPIVLNHYWNITAKRIQEIDQQTINDLKTFEVVIVRYKEDLSWVVKEFPHDKVTIYNKGPDDLEELRANCPNCQVIKIPNIGYLGGTYLKHIVDNYNNNLADRTLFSQGDPNDVRTFKPLIEHKGDLNSNCKNIIAKCVNTTLAQEWNFLEHLDWDGIPRYKDFTPRNASMLDFHYKYIGNHSLDEPIYVTYGAIFAVDKEVILRHGVEHYSVMLPEFNYTKPMVDHYMEREWDQLFDSPFCLS